MTFLLANTGPSMACEDKAERKVESLALVNALAACTLSDWLPSRHREWATVELVRTLACKSKSGRELTGNVWADISGESNIGVH